MTHTDINSKGWIAALPAGWRPYALLMRLDRPIGTWLLLLPAWWSILYAAGGVFQLNLRHTALLALFGVGAVIMRGAGCVINDLWDRDIDRLVERTRARPLASGAVSPRAAFVFLAALLLLGLLILLQTNLVTILLGFLSLPLIAVYPFMKRITWWPQLFLGIVFNFGALMGWAAVTGAVGLSALLLYIGGIFWTLGYDTIYAHQDKDDDALAGVKSSALKLGSCSRRAVAVFYALFFLCALLALGAGGAGVPAFLVMLGAGAHLFLQVKMWRLDDPACALRVFRSNRDLGLLVLLALGLS